MTSTSNIKVLLHRKCLTKVEAMILGVKNSLQEAQDAANNETKSSAGDKHETGRAMAQLETEKLTGQLAEALKLEQVLAKINPEETHETSQLGSVVYTNRGNFYIAIGIGRIGLDADSFFAISPASPIGQLLLTKKEKESFSFNNKSFEIISLI